MKRHTLRGLTGLALVALLLIGLIGCRGGGQTGAVVSEDPMEIARARGLSPADVVAAVKTYQPPAPTTSTSCSPRADIPDRCSSSVFRRCAC
ncbi:hypothetical protein [Rhodothermus marinus]|uniref:hypothetical protein n=1 Tax=Rhodothermus marinus TaxID=29549 RepID=UPI000AB96007|nr:hypothetical protein [Rhodothermus marinus]